MLGTILGDKVITSTELNRRTGEILRQAQTRPVTVTTKLGDLVILNRDRAAMLCGEEAHLPYLLGLTEYMLSRFCGMKKPSVADDFSWLDVFDRDEVFEFLKEYGETVQKVRRGRASVSDLENTVHEWNESAFALGNAELKESAASIRRE